MSFPSGHKLTIKNVAWSVVFTLIALAIIVRVPAIRQLSGF